MKNLLLIVLLALLGQGAYGFTVENTTPEIETDSNPSPSDFIFPESKLPAFIIFAGGDRTGGGPPVVEEYQGDFCTGERENGLSKGPVDCT